MALRDRFPAFGTFLDNTRATRPATGSADRTKLPDDVIAIRNGLVAVGSDVDRLETLKLGYFYGTPDEVAAKISADGGRLSGVLYVERAAPLSTTLANYAQPVNQRLTAGNLVDAALFGQQSSSSTLTSSVISGAGAVTATSSSGTWHTFGIRTRFGMVGNRNLKAGVTIRRNANWGSTPILVRIRWIASDGVTVISTTNGTSAAIGTANADDVRLFTGITSPSGAAFAEIDVVSNQVTPASAAAVTARSYVLEEVAA